MSGSAPDPIGGASPLRPGNESQNLSIEGKNMDPIIGLRRPPVGRDREDRRFATGLENTLRKLAGERYN